MDLKEFTKETLVQIVEGVKEANDAISNKNAHIHTQDESATYGISHPITNVDFDVAITTSETDGTNGGGGIRVAGFISAKGNVESKIENQTISRVKYTIQLVLGSNK